MTAEAILIEQYADYRARRLPGVQLLRPGVWCLALPFRPLVPYTLAYIVRDVGGGLHVFDPGGDAPENREMLALALTRLGGSVDEIRSISATHMHHDHMGIAAWLSERSGAPLQLHAADADDLRAGSADQRYSWDVQHLGEIWGVPATDRETLIPVGYPDRETIVPERITSLEHGDELNIDGRVIRVLHSPGHTSGHACFVFEDESLILTGDQLLPHIHPPVGKDGTGGHGAVRNLLRSLDELSAFDTFDVGPGHGYCFRPLSSRREAVAAHVHGRAAEVSRALESTPDAAVWEVARTLTWGPGWDRLRGMLMQSALSQTSLFMDFVREEA